MHQLVYLAAVRVDLSDILFYVAQTSGRVVVASRFVDVSMQQCRKMASLPPVHGRPRPEIWHDMRRSTFMGYLILFRYADDVFEVVNIREGHRDIRSAFRDDENKPAAKAAAVGGAMQQPGSMPGELTGTIGYHGTPSPCPSIRLRRTEPLASLARGITSAGTIRRLQHRSRRN